MDAPIHLPPIPDEQLWNLLCRAEEIGLRLELGESGIVWEALPGLHHQELMTAIFESVGRQSQGGSDCECYRAIDLAIRFPDGTAKRPDVAIFCKRPSEEEGFVHAVPEAVVEVTSPGYEDKDLESGRLIYLANGVRDVLVLDRRTLQVHHWGPQGHVIVPSPRGFGLACGCSVQV